MISGSDTTTEFDNAGTWFDQETVFVISEAVRDISGTTCLKKPLKSVSDSPIILITPHVSDFGVLLSSCQIWLV